MLKLQALKNNKENIIALFSFLLFWIAISFLTGAVKSGFQLTDDPCIFSIHEQINSEGLLETFKTWLIPDIQDRLRPLHLTYKILRTYLFGLNYQAWSINSSILAGLTSFFLFKGVRIQGFSLFESVIFPIFTLLGFHSVIWMHLGHDETQGVFLMSIAFYFLSLSVYSKYSKLFNVLFIIFTLLFSYTKEPFILMIPAFVFLNNYIYKVKNSKNWIESIKANKVTSIVLLSICLLDLIIIKLFLGVNKGYVGIDLSNIETYKEGLSLLFSHSWQIKFLSIMVLFLVLIQKNIKHCIKAFTQFIKKIYPAIIIFILIVLPQCLIYAKSGFANRYYLPALLGYSLLITYFINAFNRTETSKIKKSLLNSFVVLLASTLIIITYKISMHYAINGISIHNTLKLVSSQTTNSQNIVIIGDSALNYEQIVNFDFYLNKKYKKTNTLVSTCLLYKDYKPFYKDLIEKFNSRDNAINPLDIYNTNNNFIVFSNIEPKLLFKSNGWLGKNSYKRYTYGIYSVYIRPPESKKM